MFCLRNYFLLAVWLAVKISWVSAQSILPVAASVQQFRDNGGRFESVGLLTPSQSRPESALKFAPNAQFLTLDQVQLNKRSTTLPPALSLQIPYHDQLITVDLLESPVYTSDFSVLTSASETSPVGYTPGRHYRGAIRGDGRSVAAFSFFQNEVMGLISDDAHGNLVLGKLDVPGNTLDYILYADREVTAQNPFSCLALEPDLKKTDIPPIGHPEVNGCVRVYFETDYELFQSKGSVQATVDYVSGAFNELATLYANEQITTTLSQVYVWVSPDSYSTSSSSSALTQFKTLRKSFNGDIAHLVSIGGNNLGGVAWVNVLCTPSYSYAFSDINTSYLSVPTYSWTVEVLTHEMGHNLGSPHTQSCTWPGGAIDNCFTTEGGCAPGPPPVNGGTIMSYCHLSSYGINLNNGFGPLPGDKIRTQVGNAACLSGSCAPSGNCVAPKALSVTNINGSAATVSWTSASGASGYNVQWRAVGAATWSTASNVSSPYNLSGLPANDEIEVQVQSICGSTTSAYSVGLIFISSSGGGTGGGGGGGTPTCGTPGSITATATSSTTATVSWSGVTGANSYQLSYKTAASGTWSNPVNLGATNYNLSGLTASTSYNVRVAATCSGVASGYATANFTTSGSGGGGGGGTSCGVPTGLTASASSTSSVDISWTSVTGANSYMLSYKTSTTAVWSNAISVVGTSLSLKGLSASTTYNVRLLAVCNTGNSGFATTTFSTPGTGGGGTSCPAPTNLVLNYVASTTAIISWDPMPTSARYDLQIKLLSASYWMTFLSLPTTVVQILNMQPNSTYQVRVRARCAASNSYSAYTSILTITTPALITGDGTLPDGLLPGNGVSVQLQDRAAESAQEDRLQVEPNPTTGWVTLHFSTEEAEKTSLQWFDMNGRILRIRPEPDTGEDARQFDLSPYPPGVYFVRAVSQGSQPLVQRVVKE